MLFSVAISPAVFLCSWPIAGRLTQWKFLIPCDSFMLLTYCLLLITSHQKSREKYPDQVSEYINFLIARSIEKYQKGISTTVRFKIKIRDSIVFVVWDFFGFLIV